MGYWTWDAMYELDIQEIDKQHKGISVYVNELYDAAREGGDREKLKSLFDGVMEDTFFHLEYEERLLEKAGYNHDSLEFHAQAHERFRKIMRKYQSRFYIGEDITRQLIAELQIWITHHILSEDKKYVDCVKAYLAKKEKE